MTGIRRITYTRLGAQQRQVNFSVKAILRKMFVLNNYNADVIEKLWSSRS